MEKTELFETMPVPKALAKLAIPTIISQLITMIYNLADTFFIGKTNDPLKVASSSVTLALIFLMCAFANFFGIGGGSLISRLLGAKQPDKARYVSAFSFWGTVAISILYSVLVYIFMEPFLRLLGASDNTLEYAMSYTLWVGVLGCLPCTLSMTMAHLLRSEGYSRQAGFGLGLGGVLNIILDPLFMFVILEPGNEVKGAAIATLLSNVISMLYFLSEFYHIRDLTVLSLRPKDAVQGAPFVGQIVSVGFPSGLGTFLACLSTIFMTKLTSGYGDIPVAAMGIVKKIDMLPTNVGMGLCQGMLPLVAYNYAAKNYKRMKSFINAARIAGMGFAAVCIIVFEVFAEPIIRLFIEEPQTVEMGTQFLRVCCLSTPLIIFCFQMNYTFQAMGKGTQSLLLSSCRQGIICIPMLFLMRALFGLDGIVWTQLITDILSLAVALILYRTILKEISAEEGKRM